MRQQTPAQFPSGSLEVNCPDNRVVSNAPMLLATAVIQPCSAIMLAVLCDRFTDASFDPGQCSQKGS
jgi:hypothetical protein